MRKRHARKRSACALCKPHKRGWAPRWKHGFIPEEKDIAEQLEQVAETPKAG